MSNFTEFYEKNRKLILPILWICAFLVIGATIATNVFGTENISYFEDNSVKLNVVFFTFWDFKKAENLFSRLFE